MNEELAETFPYEYKGGGYWRRKGVPKNVKADTLHGDQLVQAVVDHVDPEGIAIEALARLLRIFDENPIAFNVLFSSMPVGDRVRTNKEKLDLLHDIGENALRVKDIKEMSAMCGTLAGEMPELARYLRPGRGRKARRGGFAWGIA